MIIRRLFPVAVATAILWVLSRIIDWDTALITLKRAELWLLFFGVALSLFLPIVGALRWQRVLVGLGINVGFLQALKAVMIAFSANVFAPAKSGDLLKVLVTSDTADKKLLTAGVIAERLGDLAVLGLFSGLGGWILSMYLEAGVGITIIGGILTGVLLTNYFSPQFKIIWLNKLWLVAAEVTKLWTKKPKQMGQAMVWSAVNWFLAGVQIWLFFIALGVEIGLLTVISLFPITILITLIPITPGGLGLRESVFMLLFLPYAEPHVSIAASLGYYICNTGLTALLGVGFLQSYLSVQKNSSNPTKLLWDDQ